MTRIERAKIITWTWRLGAEKTRISRNGEIHCLGKMPNAARRGLYFAGFAPDVLDLIEQEEKFLALDA